MWQSYVKRENQNDIWTIKRISIYYSWYGKKYLYSEKYTWQNVSKKKFLRKKNNNRNAKLWKSRNGLWWVYVNSRIIFGVIGFVIGLFARWGEFWNNSGIFAIILAPLFGIFIALIVGILSAIIIGPIVAKCSSNKEQAEYDSDYKYRLNEYDRLKSVDEKRVRNENIIRGNIQREIEFLEEKYSDSKKRLDEFYNYNIVDQKYWHNIVAISSFYQYLSEKRTYSLEFDQKTGDRGAYNIYNEEAQRGIIIIQLGKVLDKLDQVIENQYMLQNTLWDANRKINSLSSNINQMSRQISSSIQEQTAIQAYNAERTQAELGFMNTMNIIYNWH